MNGFVHFIHVESSVVAVSLELNGLVVSKGYPGGSAIKLISFINRTRESSVEEMVLILENLIQLRFSNIDFHQLQKAILTNDAKMGAAAQAAISIEVLDMKKESNGCVLDVKSILPWRGDFSIKKEALLVAGSGKSPLSIWNRLDGHTIQLDSICESSSDDVIKAEVDPFGKYLVLLESSG
ncbi:UNVERIFIED_CONTAM: hypothetical protein HDU68_004147, partial [Siphonaria sp. JEL0065]